MVSLFALYYGAIFENGGKLALRFYGECMHVLAVAVVAVLKFFKTQLF
ncbi:hypothetical protein [Helicobacter pylori]|nr:hypothetical protein [Helicobacter pylori]